MAKSKHLRKRKVRYLVVNNVVHQANKSKPVTDKLVSNLITHQLLGTKPKDVPSTLTRMAD